MDLIVDVGNTRAHLALFEGERLVVRADWRHADPPGERAQVLEALLAQGTPARFAIASVNRPGRDAVAEMVAERLGLTPRILRADLPDPLPLAVEQPGQVGPDRVANAFWAVTTHPGEAVCVVDAGTAVTFDVVSAEGVFLGGAIAAGIGTSARGLALLTDRLPEVRLHELDGEVPLAVGRTTEDCLAGGLFWGLVGLVEATCQRVRLEVGGSVRVFATGGDAALVAPHCALIEGVVPDLTLQGIRLALEAAP